jgi:hypothetical protein
MAGNLHEGLDWKNPNSRACPRVCCNVRIVFSGCFRFRNADADYIDKGRLLLTHYCEARNQPTLIASSISPDGNTIIFTFLSGTGMKSRDDGHMDQMTLKFDGADSYHERWTWYGNGTERWLEDIENRRVRK